MKPRLKYKRVLLKLSGEAFGRNGIDARALATIVKEVRALRRLGVELALVVGGGNIWRKRNQGQGIDEITADFIGMLATVMNTLALGQALCKAGFPTVVQSPVATDVPRVDELDRGRARRALGRGAVVVFSGATGRPFVTSDTAAAERARDIAADAIIKVGPADGVYTADPTKSKRVKKFVSLTIRQALRRKLGFMDAAALKLCAKARVPIVVCRWKSGVVAKVVRGQRVGTLVTV